MKTEFKKDGELFDHTTKMHVRVQLSSDKKKYVKLISKDKKNWKHVQTFNSLDEVMNAQQELINNNYINLFKLITN